MITLLASLLVVIFVTLAVLHMAWAVGFRAGLGAVVPEVDGQAAFEPGPVLTLCVAAALVAAAVLCAAQGNILGMSGCQWSRLGVWVLAAVFTLRAVGEFRLVGFFKRVRGTAFARWDDRLFSPLCLVIAGGCVGLNLLTAG